jgi:hypothetical protein
MKPYLTDLSLISNQLRLRKLLTQGEEIANVGTSLLKNVMHLRRKNKEHSRTLRNERIHDIV